MLCINREEKSFFYHNNHHLIEIEQVKALVVDIEYILTNTQYSTIQNGGSVSAISVSKTHFCLFRSTPEIFYVPPCHAETILSCVRRWAEPFFKYLPVQCLSGLGSPLLCEHGVRNEWEKHKTNNTTHLYIFILNPAPWAAPPVAAFTNYDEEGNSVHLHKNVLPPDSSWRNASVENHCKISIHKNQSSQTCVSNWSPARRQHVEPSRKTPQEPILFDT